MKQLLSEHEMRKILDLALKKQMDADKNMQGKVYVDHLRDAAGKMGISGKELNQAIDGYFQEKSEKKRKLIRLGIAGVVVLGLFLLYFWLSRPQTYKNPIRVVLAHKLKADHNPVKESNRFGLNQEKIYLHITWLDIKKGKYSVKYRWIDPKGKMIFFDSYQLTPDGPNYRSWSYYTPKNIDLPGKWQIEVTLDNKKVGIFAFTMEKELSQTILLQESTFAYKGEFKAVYAKEVKDNNPVNQVLQIKLGETVTAHIKWFDIKGAHIARWRWIHESGELESVETLDFNPSGTSNWGEKASVGKTWNTWDPYTPKKKGKYTTEIFLDDAYVTTLNLDVVAP